MATVLAYLPELEQQFRRKFQRHGLRDGDREPLLDAEAQAATAGERVVRAFCGAWCRGNVGAWVTSIRDNVLSEALRGVQRQRERFGRPVATGVLDTLAAPVEAAVPDQPNAPTPPAVTPDRAVTGCPSARGI
jgi:DNA-directed RNA polymerase specialized sigma24 family protein